MHPRDLVQLQVWLRSNASLADVESVERFGLLDNERFTEQARRAYRLLWEWSACRLSSEAQARFYAKCGEAALLRRIDRAKSILSRLKDD